MQFAEGRVKAEWSRGLSAADDRARSGWKLQDVGDLTGGDGFDVVVVRAGYGLAANNTAGAGAVVAGLNALGTKRPLE